MGACEACLLHSVLRGETLTMLEHDSFGRAEAAEILRLEPDAMLGALRKRQPDVARIISVRTEDLLAAAERDFGLWTLCGHEPEYPTRLRELPDPPPVIYGVGSLERFVDLGSDGVAIVGARRASAYGREVAYSLGNDASAAGMTVVSGMALGIDGAAHRGALQGGDRTIAVLAGSPEIPYPRSHRLLHEQIVERGCVISESPPGSVSRKWAFVARNRVIAAMARMTVFVEGGDSSGAKHTVRFAADLGCSVGAVPGPVTSPMSRAPNELLMRGEAALVRDFADVSRELRQDIGDLPAELFDLDSIETRVLELIGEGERTPRALIARLEGADGREVSRALGRLEMLGRIERGPGGEYLRH